MNNYHFEICNVKFSFSTERAFSVVGDAQLFQKPYHDADMHICCSATNILQPEGQLLGEGMRKCSYYHNDMISRALIYNKDFYALMKYRPKDTSVVCLEVKCSEWEWAMDQYHLWLTMALPAMLLYHRAMILHSSFIEIQGQGILFTAPSGTGKSTQANLWHRYRGAQIINGDKAGISLTDTPMAHGVPFSGTSNICENRSVPLKAIVVLSKAKENQARCLSPSEAVTALCPNVFLDDVVPKEWAMSLNLLLDLVEQVPVYALACTPDEHAVDTLEHIMNI